MIGWEVIECVTVVAAGVTVSVFGGVSIVRLDRRTWSIGVKLTSVTVMVVLGLYASQNDTESSPSR